MQNNLQLDRVRGFWRLYTTRERGWLALYFLVISVFVQAFFSHPHFVYREANEAGVVPLQLAFTVSRFKEILLSWSDVRIFKQSLWQIDFVFPLAYAGLLAFAYAWSRRNENPSRRDRFFFLAPFVAALCDWIENSLHLYLLRNVDAVEQAKAATFSGALVFAASAFAAIKIALIAIVAIAIIAFSLLALFRSWSSVEAALPYVYLLRFPALTAIGLVGLPYVSFFTGARSLLENLFDLKTFGIFFVALAAFLIAWTTMATLRLILLYGPERFHIKSCSVARKFGWGYFTRYGLLALPVVAGAVLKSGEQVWNRYAGAILMVILGLVVSLAALWVAMFWQRLLTSPDDERTSDPERDYVDLLLPSPRLGQRRLDKAYRVESAPRCTKWLRAKLEAFLSKLSAGYVDKQRGDALEGHLLAASLCFLSLLIYLGIGIAIYIRLGETSSIPALSYALWLLLLLCWLLSGLSFFFDRYRLPVLILLVILLTITAQFSESDHYYELKSLQTQETGKQQASLPASRPLSPAEAMQSDKQDSMIVVATSGGGIQAAAWTAQVLTGLEQERPGRFGRQVRLISSVSGGSVGAMYFAGAYRDDGSLDEAGLRNVVDQAMHSSLDAVAWGLVYPDLLRLLCPHCVSYFLRDVDRGQSLEEAWLRADKLSEASLSQATLAQWREDARMRRRPAMIFNATITDTGERLLLATSAPSESSQNDDGAGSGGSRNFSDLYPKHDIRIVTAARLSATFPYASPAARAKPAPGAELDGQPFHIVDGGYYDNYGISSLAQWLNEALPEGSSIKRALILQIRAFPVGDRNKQSGKQTATQPGNKDKQLAAHRGWFYESFAPISTLLNVRTAGQFAHNQVELGLLRQVLNNRCVIVETADFEFKGSDKGSGTDSPCKDVDKVSEPPLSWHLTKRQQDEVRAEWERVKDCAEAKKVKQFLDGVPPKATTGCAR